MFTTKILSKSDISLLMNVPEDVFDNSVDERYTTEFLNDPRHHIVVAITAGAIIGFVSAVHYIHPDKQTDLWINEVSVAEKYHNQGVGKRMMKEMLRLAQELGCKQAWVLTDRSNTPANRLYQSVGGKVDAGDTVMYEFDISDAS